MSAPVPDELSYEPLTPTSFLTRAAAAHGERTTVIDGARRWTYTELHDRCRRLAGALAPIAAGRPVAVLAPKSHVALEAAFGVPWAGVPLVAVNTRCRPSRSPGPSKGLLHHHRGAFLQALRWSVTSGPHPRRYTCGRRRCSTATAGASHGRSPPRRTHVCPAEAPPGGGAAAPARRAGDAPVRRADRAHDAGARAQAAPVDVPVQIATGGAPPSPAILRRMGELGLDVTHLYGLTETSVRR
jgi:AMP-binding enzyme